MLIALVALIVYFATRQQPAQGGLFGAAPVYGRGSAIAGGITGALAGAGTIASSIGLAVDTADAQQGVSP